MNFGNNTNYLNHPQYPKPFAPATLPSPQKYVHNGYRLVINSSDRDRSLYRNPNNFKIRLPRRYRNVSSIECGLIALPNYSNSEKYFLIQLEEICDGPYDSLDPEIDKALALVPNRNGLGNYSYILETPGDTSFVKNYIKKFIDVPLASLSTLTIKIKKANHDIVNFGNDLLPYDKEYSFSVTNVPIDPINPPNPNTQSTYIINTTDHDLSYDDTDNKDQIEFYNCKITYLDPITRKTVIEDKPEFNGTYTHNGVAGGSPGADKQFTIGLITDNNKFIINAAAVANNSTPVPNATNWTISGNWKRANNVNNFYSRIQITGANVNGSSIDVTTNVVHNLSVYDRIYIDYNNAQITNSRTHWYKSYHVVTTISSTTEFLVSADNITIEDFATGVLVDDVTFNPELLSDQQDNPAGDTIDTTITGVQVQTDGNFGFLQKYGDADPSIQNMLIFNINTRDEDDENVRSQNISYGNVYS